MKQQKDYLQAYHEFKESVDFTRGGFLPDLDNMVWYLLAGVPPVPGDDDHSEKGQIIALDQRLNILKAIFVELNKSMSDDFLDQGLKIYDQAGESAKTMLLETGDG
ncbi:MAG: hypothetical protein ISR61_00705 [Desulfobacteraceae bacterium]|uniref:Uncharacterized protein n=1 Tax=Candidatus Desulfacyla euxinica TaxID=2841693 RepID=A0A8J6N318_9DELT|nr:hypothetical protein [Candidatus Desulfacyla euxinica]MBL6977434.1 hypothetical protein [Desulfobacteraceae bacterium]MBL7216536.1 hypothetical protein [Desulfobacteraceae bacterium]